MTSKNRESSTFLGNRPQHCSIRLLKEFLHAATYRPLLLVLPSTAVEKNEENLVPLIF